MVRLCLQHSQAVSRASGASGGTLSLSHYRHSTSSLTSPLGLRQTQKYMLVVIGVYRDLHRHQHLGHRLRFQLRALITLRSAAQHLGGVHRDALLWMQHRRRRKQSCTDSPGIRDAEPPPRSAPYSRTPSVRRASYVRQCQKCQNGHLSS